MRGLWEEWQGDWSESPIITKERDADILHQVAVVARVVSSATDLGCIF